MDFFPSIDSGPGSHWEAPSFNAFLYDAAGVRTHDLPLMRQPLYLLCQHIGVEFNSTSIDKLTPNNNVYGIFNDSKQNGSDSLAGKKYAQWKLCIAHKPPNPTPSPYTLTQGHY